MADTQLVLGIFADEAAADAAVESLKSWDKVSDEVKLGAIGVLVVDADGQIKEHKLGARSTKKGAGIGLVLAVVAPPTLLVGLVGGGLLGRFHHKGLGLTEEDRERIGTELAGGKAAVGVLATPAEAAIDLGQADRARGDRRDPRGDRRGARGGRRRRPGRHRGARGPGLIHSRCATVDQDHPRGT